MTLSIGLETPTKHLAFEGGGHPPGQIGLAPGDSLPVAHSHSKGTAVRGCYYDPSDVIEVAATNTHG